MGWDLVFMKFCDVSIQVPLPIFSSNIQSIFPARVVGKANSIEAPCFFFSAFEKVGLVVIRPLIFGAPVGVQGWGWKSSLFLLH